MSYKDLKSYQQAAVVYDFTMEFCNRYIDRKSRTKDQMEQAARSGKQNIAEGASEKTSEKSELYLLGIARASFQELLEDYEDFLRQRNLFKWDKADTRSIAVRNLYKDGWADRAYGFDQSNKSNQTDLSNKSNLTNKPALSNAEGTNSAHLSNSPYWSYLSDAEKSANAATCLINQVNFLLDRQLLALEKNFVNVGGYRENLRKKREEEKKRKLMENWNILH